MFDYRDRYLFFIRCLITVAFLSVSVSVSPVYSASIEVYGGGGGGGGGGGTTLGMANDRGQGGAGGRDGGSGTQDGFAGATGGFEASGSAGGGGGGGGGTATAGSSGHPVTGAGGTAGTGGNATPGQPNAGNAGGAGGNGSTGTTGTPSAAANLTAYDSISVIAGSGGNGGQSVNFGPFNSGAGGSGGAGGAASLTLTGATVTSAGAVLVQSGAKGAAGDGNGPANGAGGAGGAASLTVNNTLIAPSITATKVNGALAVNITTLDVGASAIGTSLTATNTAAGDFIIGTANLSNNRLLSINNSAGAMTLSTLNVTGQGRLFVANGGNSGIGALNAAGADLTFMLPAGVVANQTIVSVTTANIAGTTIGVNDGSGRVNLLPGQSVKLIAATGGITGTAANLTVQTTNGDIFDLQVSGNELLAILQQLSPTGPEYERLKAYAEGRSATLAFVNQGQDLILNQGFGSALASTAGTGWKFGGFGGVSGGWSRYNTGSHVDVSGASFLTGLAVGNDLPVGRLTAGLFVEGGWGNYDSHNSFSNYSSVKGDGDTSYFGGGILGRWDVTSGALSGLYVDASARTGRAKMDFNTNDIKYNGNNADFDSSSWYYGAHAGLGYQWSFSEKAMLDLSGKFLWTRQEGDSVSVHDDKVNFKDADSLRTRLGGRFNYAVCDYATPYVGAYWEHEFDGKQRSTVNGVGIGSPSLKGDTGVGELGLTIKPVKDSGFSFDLGVQGYTGVREGVTGSVQLKFEF